MISCYSIYIYSIAYFNSKSTSVLIYNNNALLIDVF